MPNFLVQVALFWYLVHQIEILESLNYKASELAIRSDTCEKLTLKLSSAKVLNTSIKYLLAL